MRIALRTLVAIGILVGTLSAMPASAGLLLQKIPTAPTYTPGEPITFSYVVLNTGTTALSNVVVTDDNGTPNDPSDDVVVGTIPSLAAGQEVTLTGTLTPLGKMCMVINGTSTDVGTLKTEVLPDGNIQVTYAQSRSIVDNTYGTGAVGWPNGHKFSDFTGSDKAEFRFTDSAGNVVLDFFADYLSASSAYPSGYGTLGATGGDGSMVTGSASNIVSVTTSMTTNLNQDPAYYKYIVNSPLPEASFPNWDYVDSYTVVVKASAFGTLGYGGVSIPLVHNSPSKNGQNVVTPVPCCVDFTSGATATSGTVTSTATSTVPCAAETPECTPSVISDDFSSAKVIKAGSTIWFSSVADVTGLGATPQVVYVRDPMVSFKANGTSYNVAVPDADITFDPNSTTSSTSFDASKNRWITKIAGNAGGNALLTAMGLPVQSDLPGGIKGVQFSATIFASDPGLSVKWKWASAVYTTFNADYNALNVKPVDDNFSSAYKNGDKAGTPEAYKSFVTAGANGGGGTSYTGSYSTTKTVVPCTFGPPIATDDCTPLTLTTAGTPVTIDVLANDTSPAGLPLQILAAGPAAHGTVHINANGTITYSPQAGYIGPDTFPYSITDGRECPVKPEPPTITTQVLPDGNIKVTLAQSLAVVDNTYGTNISAGWSRHTFNDFLGSDKAEFRFTDSAGNVVLDFYADYISANPAFPSGYGTLGVLGGDGKMLIGSASNVVSVDTTMTDNLNQSPAYYGYTVNSPTLPDPNWNLVDGYTVVVNKNAFGANGFGGVTVPLVHNSPAKTLPTTGPCVSNATVCVYMLPEPPGNIQGYVYCEDAKGKTALAGVPVDLKDANNTLITSITTDSNGFYQFLQVPPGSYAVTVPPIAANRSLKSASGTQSVTVTSSATTTVPDFLYKGGTISGYAFQDTSGNCTHDSGSINLQGITITLKNAAGTVIGTTVTNASGYYEFSGCVLEAGTYTVTASGWSATLTLVGNATLTPILLPGDSSPNNNFCFNEKPGRICGTAYCQDNNGTTAVSGVLMTLKDSTGKTVATQTTDANGNYCFENIAVGSYTVVADSPSGGRIINTALSSASYPVTVTATNTSSVHPFVYKGGVISGYAFRDTNGDCFRDPGETGVAGVTVTLKNAAGTVIDTTTTAADGSYSFTGCELVAGSYTVTASGWSATLTLSGNATLTPILLPGDSSPNNNFCFHGPGNLSGHVYCQEGTNNSPLAGVTVTLYNAANQVVKTTTTDGNGFYQFTDIPVGAYAIVAPTTATGRGLKSAASLSATVVSDQTKSGFDFFYQGGIISGYAFQDTSGNCTHDAGSIGIGGITVTLKNAANQVVATTTTQSNGYYEFSGCALVAGSYTVTASGWSGTLTLSGAATLNIQLPEAGNSPNNNFCFKAPGSLSGHVYCLEGTTRTPMQGVTVTLYDSTNKVVQTASTDANGFYQFTNVPVGAYAIVAPTAAQGRGIKSASSLSATVITGQTQTGFDFAYQGGFISGYVFQDKNGDCNLNAGDVTLQGITITLKDSSGNILRTTTTDANGYYEFSGCYLVAGTYTVSAPGSVNTLVLSGNANLNITLQPAQGSPNNNFCYREIPGQLCGQVYCQDSTGRTVMAGVPVTLLDSTGKTVGTQLTDANGNYCFNNLAPGTYTLNAPESTQGRTIAVTGGNTASVTIVTNQKSTQDFVYKGGAISGYAFVDKNGDCHMDPGESGLAGVLITLKDAAGTTLATAVTQADGSYSFQGCFLVSGTYTVTAPGQVQTFTLASSATLTPILLPGQSSPNNNFCYHELPGRVCGTAYCQDSTGKTPMQGVLITLIDSTGKTVATMLTDASGNYCFENVTAGVYNVVTTSPTDGRIINTAVSNTSYMVTVTATKTATVPDFIYQGGSISGYAFKDTNGDCHMDPGETGVAGVTITLKDAAGTVLATTTTAADGSYSFQGCFLKAGTYTVTASGWSATLTLSGNATLTPILLPGQSSPNNNFCFHETPGKVCGVAYCQDSTGKTPMQGVLITLIDSTGKTVATKLTGADGSYCFEGVAAGTYNVVTTSPAGGRIINTATSNTSYTVTVNPNQSVNVSDFIYKGGAISGFAFKDTNGDCHMDPGETGLAGVTITLKDAAGTTLATTTTAADGSYSFQGCYLVSGTYTVTAPGQVQTFVLSGSATLTPILLPGQSSPNNNFCYHELPGRVCGTAYCQDSTGKTPMANVLITLIDSTGKTVQTKLTDTSGNYCFENVPSGTYNVVTESPSGGRIINTATSNTSYTVTVTPTNTSTVQDFIYQGGSISGYAFVDKNGDCHMDPGETGLGGVLITLKNAAGTVIATTTTAADGSYSFQGCTLTAGTYTLTAPGTVQTFILSGNATLTPILLPGQGSPNNNFCYTNKPTCSKILLFGNDITTEIYNYLVSDANGPHIPADQIVYVKTGFSYDPAHPTPLTDALNAKIAADGLPYCTMVFDSEYVGPAGVWSGLSTADQARLKQEILNGMGFVYAEPTGTASVAPQAQLPNVLPLQTQYWCDYRQLYKIVDPTSPLAAGLPTVFNAASSCQDTEIIPLPITGVTYANQNTVAVSASGDPTAIYSIPGTGGPSVITMDYVPTSVPGANGGRVALIGTDPFPQYNPIPGYETDFASINRLYYNAILWTGHFGSSVGLDRATVGQILKIAGGLMTSTPSDVATLHTGGAPNNINISDGVRLMRKVTGLDH